MATVSAIVPVVGFLSCRQVVGIQDNPPADLTTSACGLPYGSNACASCANTNCCAESNECATLSACRLYFQCLATCDGGLQCRSQCALDDDRLAAAPEVSALDACLASRCATACGLGCGTVMARLTPPDASDSCASCFQKSNACSAEQACAASADCDEYTRCYVACSTPDCRQACASAHDAGATFAPALSTFENACSPDCAYGANWTCVGHVTWPLLKSTTIDDTFTLLNSASQQPAAGVQFCSSLSCATCGSSASAYVTGQSDDAGHVAGPVPLPASSQVGTQSGFEGCIVFSSSSIVTTWGQFGYPLTEGSWASPPSSPYTALVLTPAQLQQTITSVGATWDAGAVIGFRTFDCLGNLAPNVQVSIDKEDSQTVVWYQGRPVVYSAANSAAPDGGATMTANSGSADGLFINVPVPPGVSYENVGLIATPVGLATRSSEVTVSVQNGVWTQVVLVPTP